MLVAVKVNLILFNNIFRRVFLSISLVDSRFSPCGFKEPLVDSRVIFLKMTCSISCDFSLRQLVANLGLMANLQNNDNHFGDDDHGEMALFMADFENFQHNNQQVLCNL